MVCTPPSFAWKDRGIVIDADIRFSSGFILEQFSPGNKATTINRCPLFIGAPLLHSHSKEPLLKTTVGYSPCHLQSASCSRKNMGIKLQFRLR
jgi:hypothetical protein